MEPWIKFNLVAFSLVIPALISGGLAVYAFTRRPVVGSRVFAFLMLALCVWSVFYGVELSLLQLEGMLASTAVEYLGITTVPVLWLIIALLYTGREKWVTRRNIILLFVIPLITIALVATNQLHHFYYSFASVSTSGPFPMIDVTRGPWYWVNSAYSYAALLTATFLLIQRLGKPGTVFRNQVTAMLIGVSVPWTVSILYVVFGLMPLGHLDPTPFAFTFTGVVMAWSMFRYKLFDIVPMAYGTVIDSIDDAIIALDGQNRIVGYNKGAHQILEFSPATIGQSAASIWKDWPALMKLSQSDTPTQIEITSGQQDSSRYYEAAIYHVTDRQKHVIGNVISLHDISKRKRTEEALRESETQYQKLWLEREAVKTRSDFLYAVSHELKTPLFLMTASLELFKELPLEERQRKFLEQEEVWHRNLLRLRFLINNLVDSQRTTTLGTQIHRVPTDLAALVNQVVKDLEAFAVKQRTSWQLALDPLPDLPLDPESIERMLHNLLTNAIKFSPPGGMVHVRLRAVPDQAVLEIQDHGKGISAEGLSDLFQPFARSSNAIKAVIPGTGLGLYVSKFLVEAHGGTISLQSTEGVGSTVTVTLPLKEQKQNDLL